MTNPANDLVEFVVARDDLARTDILRKALPDERTLPDRAVLTRVDRFAFTANNITYAKLGDALKYWALFPAPDGFGNIPVWGFGEVIASRHPEIAVGERLFGYFPMATHLVIEATDVTARGLRDAAAHRQIAAPVYNAYARVSGQPAFLGRDGDYQALLRPLFMLSLLVDDHLAEEHFFGAGRVVLSSASSKTAFGLAHLIFRNRKPIEVVGLTSASNAAFVRSLGCYHRTVTYDDIESLPTDPPSVFIDMAGNGALRARLHHHLGDALRGSIRVGMTHHDQDGDSDDSLPGAKPEWFFAPDHIKARRKAWGAGGLEQRLDAAWATLLPNLGRWLQITEARGPEALRRVYLETLRGDVSPQKGHILSLNG